MKKGQIFQSWGGVVGPSYRHDPRRVVPVRKPLKHPELHSLIDTVTHLGGSWRHEGWLNCIFVVDYMQYTQTVHHNRHTVCSTYS